MPEADFREVLSRAEPKSLGSGYWYGIANRESIVELHGGTIGLTSQLGRGSVFYFSLAATQMPG